MLRLCMILLAASLLLPHARAESVRATAVVDLAFDEKSGPAVDTAPGGRAANNGRLAAGARRVPSPFWNNSAGRALLLDAGRKQYVAIPSSPDTSRPDAATIALLFLNLHAPADGAFHGIVAKRTPDKSASTNYGINFKAQGDLLQLYVNDGSGFRTVTYSVKSALGFRRRVHLVASYAVGDAPGADKDTDADDLRVRLVVNGTPAAVTGKLDPKLALAAGTDTWLLDLKPAGLLNAAPLVLGGSTSQSEFTSGVFDEFQLFDRELTPAEAGRLFTEVAGADAAKLAARDTEPRPGLQAVPAITAISLRGLQIGKLTRMVITGKNLLPAPSLSLSVSGIKTVVAKGSAAGRLVLEITLPASAAAGLYPLRIQTPGGISNPLPIAVDHLPQQAIAVATPQQPIPPPVTVPVALSGILSGSQIARCHVQLKKGQRLVADIEARRLGSGVEPVIEIKNAAGKPLAIEWARVSLRGDTRAEIVAAADGLYTIEVHDLSYKAAAGSPFRLKVGDLALVDTVFPPAALAGGKIQVMLIGTGLPANATLTVDLSGAQARLGTLAVTSAQAGLLGPAPVIRIARGTEVLEPARAGELIDAKFSPDRRPPLTINGRITRAGEVDTLTLGVAPGQKLRLAVAGRAIDSPIDAELIVKVAGKPVASSQDRGGSRDPMLVFTVPEKTERIEVVVRDLYGRGGSHFLYRLQVTPAASPDFSLQLRTPQLNLPRVGTALIRLQVTRSGYNGKIVLTPFGDDRITLTPSVVPAGVAGVISVTVSRSAGDDAEPAATSLSLVGESVGVKPQLRRVARVARQVVPGHEDLLPLGLTRASGASLAVVHKPAALYKGLPARLTLAARALEPDSRRGQAIRIAAVSNEPPRPLNPRNPRGAKKPLVRVRPNQAVTIGGAPGTIDLVVPADVAASQIEFVLRGDLVAHGYAATVEGRIFSEPFRLPVRNAVSVTLDKKTQTLASNVLNTVKGTLKRDPGFRGAVEIEIVIDKRLGNYQGGKIIVPPGKTAFGIPVKAGQENETRVLPIVQLIVRAAGGGRLLPQRIIQLKVNPPAAKKPKK